MVYNRNPAAYCSEIASSADPVPLLILTAERAYASSMTRVAKEKEKILSHTDSPCSCLDAAAPEILDSTFIVTELAADVVLTLPSGR